MVEKSDWLRKKVDDIFSPGFIPNFEEIRQNKLESCYILAPLAIITKKYPEYVKNLMKRIENTLFVTISFYWKGEKVTETFSVSEKYDNSRHSSPLWVAFFEIAIEIRKGGEIARGLDETGFNYFIIAPCEITYLSITINPADNIYKEPEELNFNLMKLLQKSKDNDCFITADTHDEIVIGLPKGHCFSVVDCLEYTRSGGKKGLIIKIFNVWGTDEYLKKLLCAPNVIKKNEKLSETEIENDRQKGLFWMTLESFFNCFRRVCMANWRENREQKIITLPQINQKDLLEVEFSVESPMEVNCLIFNENKNLWKMALLEESNETKGYRIINQTKSSHFIIYISSKLEKENRYRLLVWNEVKRKNESAPLIFISDKGLSFKLQELYKKEESTCLNKYIQKDTQIRSLDFHLQKKEGHYYKYLISSSVSFEFGSWANYFFVKVDFHSSLSKKFKLILKLDALNIKPQNIKKELVFDFQGGKKEIIYEFVDIIDKNLLKIDFTLDYNKLITYEKLQV